MKSYAQILQARLDIINKLNQLNLAEKEELQKPFMKRSNKLLRFIYAEYSVYQFALSKIDWILDTTHDLE